MNSFQIRKPPRLAERIFHWYCDDPLQEEIAGDLEERYLDHYDKYGPAKARKKYWLNVFKFMRWHTLKRRNSKRYTQNNLVMVKNNFKVAFRSAKKHKAYSIINLSGLAVGLTSFILIVLYVQHQLSFDQFHEQKDKIFRVTNGEDAITPNIVGPFLKRNFEEEVRHSVRVIELGGQIMKIDNQSFTTNVYFADTAFFDVFTFPLLQGNEEGILSKPKTLVITQKAAMKYYGTQDVVGKTMIREGEQYAIAGVVLDPPANSMMQFDFLIPFKEIRWAQRETWSNWSFQTFLRLEDNVDPIVFEQKVGEKVNVELDMPTESEDSGTYLQSLNDIYLQKRFKLNYELGRVGDIQYVYIFSVVAFLILLIACINYVNLATSRSLERAKEVGIRKVVGAHRRQLIGQFLGESFLFVFLSLAISIAFSYWLLPYFNDLAGERLNTVYLFKSEFLLFLCGLGLIITFLAGIYPALVLSMFKPVTVLKGKFTHSGSGNRLRKFLVIVQFAISAFLVVATLVVKKQLNFIQDKNIGLDKEQVIFFTSDGDLKKNYESFKNTLMTNPNIKSVSMASNVPISVGSAHGIQTGPTDDDYELIYFLSADKEFMDLMGMELLSGLSLMERAVPFNELDTAGLNPTYIINETAAKLFNWSAEEAVGQNVVIGGYEGPVQGVVKDFHFKSMQQRIEPFVILYNPNQSYTGYVKLETNDLSETLQFIESNLLEAAPGLPFDYEFMDDYYNRMYRFESRLGNVFLTFASIAVFIACLGMFGLISFIALHRAKEMGIRKVLGASFKSILILLSADFLKLIAIALMVGLPVAYFFMGDWLSDYVYRINMGADVAIVAIVFALLITMLTIAYQAVRTAMVNPSKVLRSE
ncbi:ABC transporter permease [Roseivirga sp. E12]|uniref:ABC transporter permease n=1 Tax=Roseivirga sp. E12 TaxID=2819237 RepID=UPI001ABD3683|nr:ABC transporter permease [Roseivirga sp. E12]MBO3700543.1 ABC transporter permease [Roseivirga sp. E12]